MNGSWDNTGKPGLQPGGPAAASTAGRSAGVGDAGAARVRTLTKMSLLGVMGVLAATTVVPAELRLASPPAGDYPAAGDPAVTRLLEPIRRKNGVPAMAAALVTSKGLVTAGVVGTRKRGADTAVTLSDRWHLSSDTKAMTATLLAKLVERGLLKWNTSMAEVFPDLAPGFGAEARTITVLQLLSHRSGLKAFPDLALYGGADGAKERLRLVKDELSRVPTHKPGRQFEYSNLGYCIAGAVAERVVGNTWEQAMQDEVCGPLEMESVGFGSTGAPGQRDQPWGHGEDGKPAPGNSPVMNNPPVLSPAVGVHCTIGDWARFIADQLRGGRGEPALLQAESYRNLHTPTYGGYYALGWFVVERAWGGGKVLNHAGDSTMNYANAWLAPRGDFAILVCINQGGSRAFHASAEAVNALIRLHAARTASTEPVERKGS